MDRTVRKEDGVDGIRRLSREIALNREFIDEKEAAFLSLVWTWLRIERTGRQFFGAHDITSAQFNVLMILWDYRRGALRQNELAELLVVNQASMGGVIDRLERRGWIKREDDPQDRRAYFVRLTDSGVAKMKEVRAPYYKLLGAAFDGFGKSELIDYIQFNDDFRMRLATLAGPPKARKPVKPERRVKGG